MHRLWDKLPFVLWTDLIFLSFCLGDLFRKSLRLRLFKSDWRNLAGMCFKWICIICVWYHTFKSWRNFCRKVRPSGEHTGSICRLPLPLPILSWSILVVVYPVLNLYHSASISHFIGWPAEHLAKWTRFSLFKFQIVLSVTSSHIL